MSEFNWIEKREEAVNKYLEVNEITRKTLEEPYYTITKRAFELGYQRAIQDFNQFENKT